MHNKVALKEY